jgi:hypothetical protein
MRASVVLLALLPGCVNNYYYLDLPDVDIPPPADLDVRLRRYRSGEERWHGDAKEVADLAIRRYADVPWKADPFNPRYYELLHKPEWGHYVTRGYRYPSGNEMRYRVKIRKHEEIWYPVQLSRHKIHEVPEDRAHTLDHHH